MRLSLILILITLVACTADKDHSKLTPLELVNPFIGTGGHGHTFPGATWPFGMVQLSPDTRLEGWDGCSGYHYTDDVVYGFSHTHLSGTGVSDYGDVLFMPITGEVQYDNGYESGRENGYASLFDKKREVASPGYYSTFLSDYDVKVELTCTKRTGIHKYTFAKGGEVHVILDLEHRDQLLDHEIKVIDNQTIQGKRISKAWAEEQHVYYHAKFSRSFTSTSTANNGSKASFTFNVEPGESIILKVGISAVDKDGAKLNLFQEAKHWDFEQYKSDVELAWKAQLNKINIKGGSQNDQSIFYTALYHNMIAPNVFSDIDGRYRGMDMNIHQDKDQKTYTVFSLWDTFRATHPLYTIIEQEKTNEFINTFLKHHDQGGLLPVWELAGNETNCMIGFHSASVITDAFVKEIRGFDHAKAINAMIKSSNADKDSYTSEFPLYVAASQNSESVSKTLEYAYDNWCVKTMIDNLDSDYATKELEKKMLSYRHLFDEESGFMRPRKNGGWYGNFDPTEVNFHFTEANSWQYSMFIPHNITDMIYMFGGDEAFENKLDELFSTSSELTGRHQSDITGLIGQYAHGNEPSHHMAYLYNYVGKPSKTQVMVHRIINEMYQNAPDGLSGNEDCGQMSAWYVFSAMGFYPVTPGLPYYTLGSPLFEEISIHLENGNTFVIKSKNYNPNNIYIESVQLNGKEHPFSFIDHKDIINGGELVFNMTSKPNNSWGTKAEHRPVSKINDQALHLPVIKAPSQTFLDSMKITIDFDERSSTKVVTVNYSKFGIPGWDDEYSGPFYIYDDCKIDAFTINQLTKDILAEKATFYRIDQDRSIELLSNYPNQYAASGNDALIDRIRGSDNFRTGDWQGYQGQDLEAIITFDKPKEINRLALSALQDIRSWIWYPKKVDFYTSEDEENWELLGTVHNTFSDRKEGGFTQELALITNIKTKHIKVIAENYGICPDWHLGAGGDAWVFVDEIIIE